MTKPRILVLRPADQIDELAERLRRGGAEVVSIPAVEIIPNSLPSSLGEPPDWALFTSVNGVRVASHLIKNLDHVPKVAAVGPATRDELLRGGLPTDWMPEKYTTVSLAEGIPAAAGQTVVAIRASEAGPELEEILGRRGIRVIRIDAYSTNPVNQDSIRQEVETSTPDLVVFTSASIARSFAAALEDLPFNGATCSIGPATSSALASLGLPVTIEAEEHTIDGVVAALEDYLERKASAWRD